MPLHHQIFIHETRHEMVDTGSGANLPAKSRSTNLHPAHTWETLQVPNRKHWVDTNTKTSENHHKLHVGKLENKEYLNK